MTRNSNLPSDHKLQQRIANLTGAANHHSNHWHRNACQIAQPSAEAAWAGANCSRQLRLADRVIRRVCASGGSNYRLNFSRENPFLALERQRPAGAPGNQFPLLCLPPILDGLDDFVSRIGAQAHHQTRQNNAQRYRMALA